MPASKSPFARPFDRARATTSRPHRSPAGGKRAAPVRPDLLGARSFLSRSRRFADENTLAAGSIAAPKNIKRPCDGDAGELRCAARFREAGSACCERRRAGNHAKPGIGGTAAPPPPPPPPPRPPPAVSVFTDSAGNADAHLMQSGLHRQPNLQRLSRPDRRRRRAERKTYSASTGK